MKKMYLFEQLALFLLVWSVEKVSSATRTNKLKTVRLEEDWTLNIY